MTLSKRETDKLISDHMGFVRARAARAVARYGFLEVDEVHAECMLQLVRRVHRFDPTACPFSVFAISTIDWTVKRLVRMHMRRHKNCGEPEGDGEMDAFEAVEDTIEERIDAARRTEKMAAFPVLRRRLIGFHLHEISDQDGVAKSTALRRERAEINAARAQLKDAAG